MVEIFNNRVEFTNPGASLVDKLRVIDSAPQSRNEMLARFMRKGEPMRRTWLWHRQGYRRGRASTASAAQVCCGKELFSCHSLRTETVQRNEQGGKDCGLLSTLLPEICFGRYHDQRESAGTVWHCHEKLPDGTSYHCRYYHRSTGEARPYRGRIKKKCGLYTRLGLRLQHLACAWVGCRESHLEQPVAVMVRQFLVIGESARCQLQTTC